MVLLDTAKREMKDSEPQLITLKSQSCEPILPASYYLAAWRERSDGFSNLELALLNTRYLLGLHRFTEL